MHRAPAEAANNIKNAAENRKYGHFTTRVLDAYSVINRYDPALVNVSTCITEQKY